MIYGVLIDRSPTGLAMFDGRRLVKGYIVTTYLDVSDQERFEAYAKLAGPAIELAGGRFLVRGTALDARELGRLQRSVVIEFDSVAAAEAAYDSDGYRQALLALGDGATRDVRILAGFEQK